MNFYEPTTVVNATGKVRRQRMRRYILLPQNLTGTQVSGTQIQLDWEASFGYYVHGYEIWRDGLLVTSVSGITYCDCLLQPGQSYTYKIRAFNNYGGLTDFTNEVTADTVDTLAPSTPTGLTASSPFGTRVELNWDEAVDNVEVLGYKLYRDGVQVGGIITQNNYTDDTVVYSTVYSYTVLTVDTSNNESVLSAGVSVTTPANVFPSSSDLFESFSPGFRCTLARQPGDTSPFGGVAMEMTVLDNDPFTSTYFIPVHKNVGEVWRISVWAKSSIAGAGIQLFIINPAAHGSFSTTTSWAKYSHDFTIVQNTTTIAVRIDGGNPGQVHLFDGYTVERVS